MFSERTISSCFAQVWFQNARAKLRRSLTADSPPQSLNLPSAGGDRAATEAMSQSQPFPSSTIDQLQLSLLTAPLSPPPPQQQNPRHTYLLLDYTSHGAPGSSSVPQAAGDCGSGGARVEAEDHSGEPYGIKYY